jgi:hypothetical protein
MCDANEADPDCFGTVVLAGKQKKKNQDFIYKILDDSSKYHLTIKQITI